MESSKVFIEKSLFTVIRAKQNRVHSFWTSQWTPDDKNVFLFLMFLYSKNFSWQLMVAFECLNLKFVLVEAIPFESF